MAANIRVGTCGWSDPGYAADWYPSRLPAGARLRWYAERFDYVEVNSTFYAIPTARTVERWATETPDNFLFDVKLPKVLSRHRMHLKLLPPDLRARVLNERGYALLTPESQKLIAQRFLREIQPLADAGKLGALLLQLAPAFAPATHRLTEIDSLREELTPHPLAVELRHREWVSGPQLNETLAYFRSRRMTLVSVDAPESDHFTVMPRRDDVTNPALAYFRLHGRNLDGYIAARSVAERFDYEYSSEETDEIVTRLRAVSVQAIELHVAANNNRSSQALKLTRALRMKLGLPERAQGWPWQEKGQKQLL